MIMKKMRTIKKVLPGKPGTKKLLEKYGEKFVCLRYRNDFNKNKRLKTVELIVDERELVLQNKIPYNKVMYLKIEYGEIDLARLVKGAGGKWNRPQKYWELPYGEVQSLGLESRIINKNG